MYHSHSLRTQKTAVKMYCSYKYFFIMGTAIAGMYFLDMYSTWSHSSVSIES